MGIEQIKKHSISDQVYEQLRMQLIRGEWKSGDRLPSESELVTDFGVSRITVRQAIQKLVVLGLLETRLGEGTFVKTFTPGTAMQQLIPAIYLQENSVLEVIEFRRVIEVPTAELAAKKAEDKDIESLTAIYDRMLSMHEHNHLELFRTDLDFHLELAEITKNSLIIATYSILRDILEVAMERIVHFLGNSQGLYYHRLLLDAMCARDAVLCRRVMDDHISDTYNSIENILKHQ